MTRVLNWVHVRDRQTGEVYWQFQPEHWKGDRRSEFSTGLRGRL